MKKIITYSFFTLLLLLANAAFSQQTTQENEGFEGKNLKTMHADTEWYKMMQVVEPNLFEIQKAYDRYFLVNVFEKSKETRAFEFWKKHIVGDNYDANGNVGKQNLNYDDLKLLESKSLMQKAKSSTSTADNWQRIIVRPDIVPAWSGGCYTQGTCNMLAINPSNSNEMIGAFIDGGTLWRTTDNCATWTQCAPELLLRQFGSVVYCKSNPLIVYAGSAQGVIKSLDGGATWKMTAYDQRAGYPGGSQIWAMEVKADDPNTVVFAIDNKLYRTINGGTNWTTSNLTGTSVRDLRALPADPKILFMTIKNGTMAELRRSADFGATWTKVTNGFPTSITGFTGEMALVAVTPAAPKSVWVHLICTETATAVAKTYDVYKSVDGGLSFSRLNIATDISQKFYQGGWNQAFALSDTDSLLMSHASWGVYITRDGGKTWSIGGHENSKGNVHSDLHCLVIKGQTLWAAGDGGIQKTTNYGVSYDETSDDGIQCQCLWGFDQGWKSDIMATGMYHGPTTLRDDAIYNGWYPMGGADAGIAFVNTSDDRYIYAAPWSTTRFTRSSSASVKPTAYDIPSLMKGKGSMNDPDYYQKLYGANATKLMVSGDNATTFVDSYNFAANLSDYVVALSNNKIAYARTGNTIMRTEDGGILWTNVSPTTILSGQSISQMVIDGTNPDVIWVSFDGKQSAIKVGKSTNGGKNWVNYSGTGLPSYSINTIIAQMGTNGDVYVGTDAGVYYRNNSMTTWVSYSANLPLATHAEWLKINYAKSKLRLAGQTGIWETDLNSISTPFAHPSTPFFETSVGKQVPFVDMSVCKSDATFEWTFPDGTPATSTLEKPTVTFSKGGDKNITLKVTDANGTDTRTYNNFIRVRPVIDVPKTGWVVTYSDSQYNTTTYVASNVIDGNNNTIWVSKGTGATKYPHDIQVDMGSAISIESFKYTPRQDGNILGKVKAYEWYVSTDGVNWGTPVASGSYDATDAVKVTTLTTPATGRYFRFRPISANDGSGFASVAELGVNGSNSIIASFTASATLVNAGTTVKFTDGSAGNPTSWLWSFPGGTPSTSTEQNPVVQYKTDGVYPVTLVATGTNGSDTQQRNSFITVSKYLPTSGWSVKYVDSEESKSEKTPAANIIDGSIGTIWHTQYSPTITPFPHEVQIDMGANYAVTGFTYVPRQSGVNGRIAKYEFYVSTDGNTWSLTNSGTFPNSTAEQAMTFPVQTIRYFKMKALSEVNGGGYAAIAEIKLPYAQNIASAINDPLNNNMAIYSYQNEIKVSIQDQTHAKMQVYDITGQQILTTNIYQGVNSVAISQPGIYIVKVLLNNSIISKKVIVE